MMDEFKYPFGGLESIPALPWLPKGASISLPTRIAYSLNFDQSERVL